MRHVPWRGLLLAVPLAGCLLGHALPSSGQAGAGVAPQPDLLALVAAERAFAADAAARSVREAFLAWLDDDALVMAPRATAARAFYAGRPPSAARLVWEPVFAAVSRSGELGYTTGPWSWRAGPRDTVAAWGDFVTVWRRHADGAWRVAIDLGVSHARPSGEAPVLGWPGDGRFGGRLAAGEVADGDRTEAAGAELQAAEAVFAARVRHRGAAAAYEEFAHEGIRCYREGMAPLLGRDRALRAVRSEAGRAGTSRTLGLGVALAGDLGYAWGETVADDAPSPSTSWVRIWSRGAGGIWRIVLDITLPVPPEPAGG